MRRPGQDGQIYTMYIQARNFYPKGKKILSYLDFIDKKILDLYIPSR